MIKVYKGYKQNKLDIIRTVKINTPTWITFTIEVVLMSLMLYAMIGGLMVVLPD